MQEKNFDELNKIKNLIKLGDLDPSTKRLILSGMRKAFVRSPKYRQALNEARVEIPKILKGGNLSNVPSIRFKCKCCKELIQMTKNRKMQINVDHIEPVIPIGMSESQMTIQEYWERLDCFLTNLQILCIPCHKEKSAKERKARVAARKLQ